MHLVTGFLVAAAAKRLRGHSTLPLLRTGPVQAAHVMPGRVRFRVPSLTGQSAQAAELQSRLSSLEGIKKVEAQAATGSVVVEYRPQVVRPALIFAAIVRLLGLDKELQRTSRPVVVRQLRSVISSLDTVVYDRTSGVLDFSSAMLILLAAFGARRLFKQGVGEVPAGATLVWWGMHQLLGHGEE